MTNYRDFYRELRTDWLKLRGYLFDSNTRLPSLPVVLDEVRRRLEEEEEIGLIYLVLAGGRRLEEGCGWQLYDQMIRDLASAVQDYRTAHFDTRDVVAQVGVRSAELALFVGLDGNGGLAALERSRKALTSVGEEALGIPETSFLPTPRIHSAAIRLVTDPKVRVERSIYQTLESARVLCRRDSERRQSRRLSELRRMLGEGDILTRFQPIVRLQSGDIHGFEALSAAPTSDYFSNPEILFTFAEQSDVLVELERLCRQQATRRAVPLMRHDGVAAGGKLFVNCSAQSFADPELPGDLARSALAAGLDPSDLVVEVTERVAITEWQLFRRALSDLRRAGLRIAIDDMGSGYSSLHAVAEIQPDYLKFDFSLIHNIHRSSIKRDLLETLIVMADKFGARSIAEGIELEEELETVREMGVHFGQGYFLAAPAPPAEVGQVHFPR